MTTLKNIRPVTAEQLFNLLKKEFADYVNSKLDSGLTIDYAHVYDMINILFPDIIAGIAFTITVMKDEITIAKNEEGVDYDIELLETYLVDFLTEKCE